MSTHESDAGYDVVVIGSGPGGQKAAIAAAKLGKSVAFVERGRMLAGSASIPAPSPKDVAGGRGLPHRYEPTRAVRRQLSCQGQDHARRPAAPNPACIGKQVDVVRNQLTRNRIGLLIGHGRFIDAHTVFVEDHSGSERTTLRGDYIIIPTGTRPAQPGGVELDDVRAQPVAQLTR